MSVPLETLRSAIGQRVHLHTTEGSTYEGVLVGFDLFANILLKYAQRLPCSAANEKEQKPVQSGASQSYLQTENNGPLAECIINGAFLTYIDLLKSSGH